MTNKKNNGDSITRAILIGVAIMVIGNIGVDWFGNSMSKEVIELNFKMRDKEIDQAKKDALQSLDIARGMGEQINKNTEGIKKNKQRIDSVKHGTWNKYRRLLQRYEEKYNLTGMWKKPKSGIMYVEDKQPMIEPNLFNLKKDTVKRFNND